MQSHRTILVQMIALYLALLLAAGLLVGLATDSVGFGLLGAFGMMCVLPFVSTGGRIWYERRLQRRRDTDGARPSGSPDR